jgi:hypothetical protein
MSKVNNDQQFVSVLQQSNESIPIPFQNQFDTKSSIQSGFMFNDPFQNNSIENICETLGFDIHQKQGKQILRKFLLFCFPKGISSLITQSKIKNLSLKDLVPYIEIIEKRYSETFNSRNFQIFIQDTKI